MDDRIEDDAVVDAPAGTAQRMSVDVAAMVGATRPAVNRIVQPFASQGLISVNGRVIVLRDLSALRRRADM